MIKKLLPNKLLLFITAFAFVTAVTNVSAGQKNDKVSVPVAETIIIDGCDSGIADQTLENGSLMSNLIADCAEGVNNHGAFVSCVAQLTNEWKQDGLIDGQAKGAIQRCAARANIPPSDLKCKADADCDDGVPCNGTEVCLDKMCQPGTPVECPDDGLFCNGRESCDESSGSCVSSGDPCVAPAVCHEETDICGCGSDADCDDGIFCNGPETCLGGACQPGTPAECPDNGVFCDGTEYCDMVSDRCISSGDPCEAPYSCDEPSDSCVLIACGNGIPEPGEQCDDGNVLNGDCCSATCAFEPAESPCPDIEYCDGVEACDGAGVCLDTTPVDCSDGVACTVDTCDETADICMHDPDNAYCSDGLYCTGIEVCDPASGCQPGTPVVCPDDEAFCTGTEYCDENADACASTDNPCPTGTVCNDDSDSCDPLVVCGNRTVEKGEDCDDGNTEGGDCCSATCTFEPAESPCPDIEYCDGVEACDGAGVCLDTTPVDCSDGVACTVDTCDETADICMHDPDNAYCSDGLYCTGIEVCDPASGCQPGTPVVCPDDEAFCTGTEYCDENADACASTDNPCQAGYVCNDDSDSCDPLVVCGNRTVEKGEDCDDGNTEGGDCCSATCTFEPAESPCPDIEYCDGVEACDGAGVCLDTTPVDCSDGVACTVDTCDETADICMHDPDNAYCSDGLYCTGIEVCDPASGCQPGTPVVCPDDEAFCTGTEYCDENADACASTDNPCQAGYVCNDDSDSCDPLVVCGNRTVEKGEDCDDGNTEGGDCCSATCTFEPAESPCPDIEYCDGVEACDGAGVCLDTTPVDCSDGVACTVDTCDETADICMHDPDNAYCSDGLYCTGIEVCDPASGCQPGTPVDCPDNGAYCDGTEICDEVSDSCIGSGDPCPGVCDEETDVCQTVLGSSLKRMFLIWQQGR